MERLNLRQLKEELNKVPDEKLQSFSIAHYGYCDDPQAKIGLVFWDAEENHDKHLETMSLEPMKKISKHFSKYLNKDCQMLKNQKKFFDMVEDGKFEDADWEY